MNPLTTAEMQGDLDEFMWHDARERQERIEARIAEGWWPYRGSQVPYAGPNRLTGRMLLLAILKTKAQMARASHTAKPGQPPIARSERGTWELVWIWRLMTPLGDEGKLRARWQMLRDRWIGAGCPRGFEPWTVLEGRR